MNDMNGMDPNQPRVRDKKYQLKSLIHKTDALFVLHQFENIHSWVDVSQIHKTWKVPTYTNEIDQVGQANNLKSILTRLTNTVLL